MQKMKLGRRIDSRRSNTRRLMSKNCLQGMQKFVASLVSRELRDDLLQPKTQYLLDYLVTYLKSHINEKNYVRIVCSARFPTADKILRPPNNHATYSSVDYY
jgi:hypothetical protein